MCLIGSLWDSSGGFHRDAAHSAGSADRTGFQSGHVGPHLRLSLCSQTHSHTLKLNLPPHEPTTTRHPNVSVSSCWSVLGNLELSQVIPNYLNLQNVAILSRLSDFCTFPPPPNLRRVVLWSHGTHGQARGPK